MVIWLIGLSGVGKTTISKLVYEKLKPKVPNLVRLDGDVLRGVFGNDVDHSVQGRLKNAERLAHLSKLLSDQEINVVAAVLSIFPDWRKWNRENIHDYAEVYLKASVDSLINRGREHLYIPAREGKMKNVVGVDIEFPEPKSPDLIIENEKDRTEFGEFVDQIISIPVVRNLLV
jgi:cytidine diphosphoramidate kinase